MNNNEGSKRRREIQRHEAETAADAERMLENTRRFLENLSESAPDSRRYVSGLKDKLEKEVRQLKSRKIEPPDSSE